MDSTASLPPEKSPQMNIPLTFRYSNRCSNQISFQIFKGLKRQPGKKLSDGSLTFLIQTGTEAFLLIWCEISLCYLLFRSNKKMKTTNNKSFCRFQIRDCSRLTRLFLIPWIKKSSSEYKYLIKISQKFLTIIRKFTVAPNGKRKNKMLSQNFPNNLCRCIGFSQKMIQTKSLTMAQFVFGARTLTKSQKPVVFRY